MVGLGLGPSGQPSPSSSEAHQRLGSIPRAGRARQQRRAATVAGHVTRSTDRVTDGQKHRQQRRASYLAGPREMARLRELVLFRFMFYMLDILYV